MAVKGSAAASFFMVRPANGIYGIYRTREAQRRPPPSACDLEGLEHAHRARVTLVHDAAPAARAQKIDDRIAVEPDEHPLRRPRRDAAGVAGALVDRHHGGPGEEVELRCARPRVGAHCAADDEITRLQGR